MTDLPPAHAAMIANCPLPTQPSCSIDKHLDASACSKPQTAMTSEAAAAARRRWTQVRSMMQRITRGMPAESAQRGGAAMLHKDFWLEALDEQHRYGFHLRAFHKAWKDDMAAKPETSQPKDMKRPRSVSDSSFFYWLDHGRGRSLDLPECSQNELRSTHVQYCDPEQRKPFELTFVTPRPAPPSRKGSSSPQSDSDTAPGALVQYAATNQLVNTDSRSKWIFVVDLHGRMYLGRKRKGIFHHTSFVAGAPVYAAGKIMIKHGKILAIEPHSGHFKPNLKNLTALLYLLHRRQVDVDQITFIKPKKWANEWPFPVRPSMGGLEDLEDTSDTDYAAYRSDNDDGS